MTYGVRKGSILQENMQAYSAQKDTTAWMNKRKMLCLSCQKEKPGNMGATSWAGGKTDGTRGSTWGNSLKRWICFDCKPAKVEA